MRTDIRRPEKRNQTIGFNVASNPEFLKEGAAIGDFTRPDRIVVGTDSSRVEEMMQELYAPYNRQRDKLIFMDVRSAELTKYAANSMLATKISFINEIANIAESVGADIEQVRIGMDRTRASAIALFTPAAVLAAPVSPRICEPWKQLQLRPDTSQSF